MANIVDVPGYGNIQFPDEMSRDEISNIIRNKILKQPEPTKEEPGAFGRIARGFTQTAQSMYESGKAGIESTFEPDIGKKAEIFRKAQEREEKRSKEEPSSLSLDKITEAYKKGILPAAGEVLHQIPEAVGSAAASMIGAPVGAIVGGIAAPGVGAIPGAMVGMGATSFLSQYGQNLQRQYEEQIKRGEKFDPQELKAAGWAAASAALDVGAFKIPFGKLFGKIGTESAEKLAKESVAKSLAKGAVIGPLAEVPTEVAQQMMERYQAGMDLTSDDAIKEYNETAAQVLMGMFPLGAAGRYAQRGRAKAELAGIEQQKQEAAQLAQQQSQYLAGRGAEAEQADIARQAKERAEAEEAASAEKPMLALPAPTPTGYGPPSIGGIVSEINKASVEQRDNQFVVVSDDGRPIQAGFRTEEEANDAANQINQTITDRKEAEQEQSRKEKLGSYVDLANKISRAGSVPIYFGEINTGLAAKIFNRRTARQGQSNVLDTNAPFTTPQEIQALELNEDRDLTIVQNKKNGTVELKSGGPKPGELNLSERLLQGQEPGINVAEGLAVRQEEEAAPAVEEERKPALTPVAEKYLDDIQDRNDPTKFTPKNTDKVTNQLKSIAQKNDIDLKKTVTKEGVETTVDKTPQDIVDELVAKRNRPIKMAAVPGEAAKEPYGPQPRPPRTAQQIGFEKAQARDRIKSAIKTAFDNLGLTKQGIKPDVVSYIADESGKPTRGSTAVAGEFNPSTKTITLASDIYDPNLSVEELTSKMMDVVNHEVVHALKQAGLFSPKEWNILENYVKNGDGRKFLERAKIQYPDLNMSKQIEEAIAEAAREFDAGNFKPVGAPRGLIKRIVDFFKGLFSAAKSNNTTPDQIFNAIRTGEIGERLGTPQAGGTMQSRVSAPRLAPQIQARQTQITPELTNPRDIEIYNGINKDLERIKKHLSPISEKEGMKMNTTYMDYVKEFFNPYHTLGKGADIFRIARAMMSGRISEISARVKEISSDIAAAKKDRENIFRYMTTRNADPSTIVDAKARKAAIEAKQLINKISDELVERKLITPGEREKYRDEYLHRTYLAYFDKKRFIAGGTKPGMGYYLKSREELTPEQRASLGEIEDPAFLVMESIFAPLRDLSILNYFEKLNKLGNGKWILGMGKNEYTAPSGIKLNLSLPELKSFAENLQSMLNKGEIARDRESQALSDIRDMNSFIQKRENELNANVDRGNYIQMPTDKDRYGPLAGLWIARPIYRDIMGMGSFLPNNMSGLAALFADGTLMSKANRWFKASKVAMNPPTIATNIISNALMMHMADVPMHRILPLTAQMLNEIVIKKSGKYYELAKKYGLKETTLSETELKVLYRELENRKSEGSDLNKMMNMFRALGDSMSNLESRAADFYGGIETVFKSAIIKDAIERQGLSEEEAVLKANKYLFDYSEVHDSIKYIRNMPFGAPFITWSYKMAPLLIETALTKPWKFAPYAAMYFGISALASMGFAGAGGSDEDKDKLKKYLSKYNMDNPFVLVTSPTTAVDFGKFLPFTPMYNFGSKMAQGKIVEAFKSIGFFGGPLADIAVVALTGKDPFTGRDVVPKGSTEFEKFVMNTNYIANTFMPSFMRDLPQLAAGAASNDPELVARSSSITADALKMAFEGPKGKAAGLPVKDPSDLVKNFFGINTYHPSIEQFRRNALTLQKELNEITTEFNRTMKQPDLSPIQRKVIIDKYTELRKEKMKEIGEFYKNSNLSPAILKVIQDSVTRQ
jgi:hypothetical protein